MLHFYLIKKNIQNRLENLDKNDISSSEERDKIDEIDDPFDLYSEYKEVPESELTPEKIKEIIDEEKSRVKQNVTKKYTV